MCGLRYGLEYKKTKTKQKKSKQRKFIDVLLQYDGLLSILLFVLNRLRKISIFVICGVKETKTASKSYHVGTEM